MRLIGSILAPAILALTTQAAVAASAVPSGAVSALALNTLDFVPTIAAIVPADNSCTPGVREHYGSHAVSGWAEAPPSEDRTRYDAIRYRNRGSRSRSSVNESPVQIHLGFFDFDGSGSGSFVAGLRGGPQIDPHIQVGGAVDWVHRSEDRTVVAGDPYTQGTTVITPTRVLSRASTNLFPFQLFLQASGDANMPVIPYGGISGGYQMMFLSADDFATQTSFDATFGGWGWQAWAGAGIPLSGQSRLTGEVYVSQADPEREVTASNGQTYLERVNADGVGMRFGIQWGF